MTRRHEVHGQAVWAVVGTSVHDGGKVVGLRVVVRLRGVDRRRRVGVDRRPDVDGLLVRRKRIPNVNEFVAVVTGREAHDNPTPVSTVSCQEVEDVA